LYTDLCLDEAVLKCREFGFEDQDIVVDVIQFFNTQILLKTFSMDNFTAWGRKEMIGRKDELHGFYHAYENIQRVMRGFPKVNFRNIFVPEFGLGSDQFKDDERKLMLMMTQGKIDAKRVLESQRRRLVKVCLDQGNSEEECHPLSLSKFRAGEDLMRKRFQNVFGKHKERFDKTFGMV